MYTVYVFPYTYTNNVVNLIYFIIVDKDKANCLFTMVLFNVPKDSNSCPC